MKPIRLFAVVAAVCGLPLAPCAAQETAKPLKIMLITGGCCHDYKAQKDILKKGIEERINATVEQIHVDDSNTKPALPIFGNPDYAAGYDLVIHDECAADIKDPAVVKGVIKPHADGTPAVCLHCAMHCYRTGEFRKKFDTLGTDGSLWFEMLGLQSSGHGPKKPIAISFTDKEHPISKGFADWVTGDEELYNNIHIFDQAHPLASGKQGKEETVVVWTNLYGKEKTRVFCTTIGHFNATVEDARYLDLVARGVLWATDKLAADGSPKAGYGKTKK